MVKYHKIDTVFERDTTGTKTYRGPVQGCLCRISGKQRMGVHR